MKQALKESIKKSGAATPLFYLTFVYNTNYITGLPGLQGKTVKFFPKKVRRPGKNGKRRQGGQGFPGFPEEKGRILSPGWDLRNAKSGR